MAGKPRYNLFELENDHLQPAVSMVVLANPKADRSDEKVRRRIADTARVLLRDNFNTAARDAGKPPEWIAAQIDSDKPDHPARPNAKGDKKVYDKALAGIISDLLELRSGPPN